MDIAPIKTPEINEAVKALAKWSTLNHNVQCAGRLLSNTATSGRPEGYVIATLNRVEELLSEALNEVRELKG